MSWRAPARHRQSCLTPPQVETVRRVYSGVKTKDGQFAAMPLMRGGESDWVARMVGTPQQPRGVNSVLGAPFMSYIVKNDPAYDIMRFDPERDMAALESGLAAHVHQQNPDISAFVGRGGKLLLWHGFNDPGPSPLSTIAYFDAVREKVPAAKDSVRLFLAPGVLHCGGGAGPDRFDSLTAMEQWVEHGTPPASMIATKANQPLSRPLCPYPQLARYKGAATRTTRRVSRARRPDGAARTLGTVDGSTPRLRLQPAHEENTRGLKPPRYKYLNPCRAHASACACEVLLLGRKE